MIYLTPSSVPRVALCPGSLAACRGLKDESGSAAQEGQLLHAACADGITAHLLPTQQDDVARAIEARDALIAEHLNGTKYLAWKEKFVRTRIEDACEINGKLDFYARAAGDDGKPIDDTFLVVDYKFGRGDEDDPSEHHQLRSYAILLYREHGAKRVIVALIQPRAAWDKRVRTVTYEAEHLEQAVAEVLAIAKSAEPQTICEKCATPRVAAPNAVTFCDCGNDTYTEVPAPRIPGPEQCKFCRACGTERCPESQALILLQPPGVIPTGAEMSDLLDKGKVAVRAYYQLEDWAKEMLRRGEAIPGYELKENASHRTIENPMAAWNALAEIVTPEEFVCACGVSVGELEEIVCRKQGIKPQRLWRDHFGALLGDVIGKKEIAPSLKRTK